MPIAKDRELDVLNSACCRVKGVELVAGDVIADNFESLVGADVEVTFSDGTSTKLSLKECARAALPLMRAMLPTMRAALRRLRDETVARGVAVPPIADDGGAP